VLQYPLASRDRARRPL